MRRLAAADGLALDLSGPSWRIAWDTPGSDWLGPIAFGTATGPARPKRLDPFEGADDLGSYRGVDVAWDPSPEAVRTTVRAYRERPLLVFRLEALEELEGLATGRYAEPSVVWPLLEPGRRRADGVPEGTRGFGHQFTEFAFPTFSGPSLADFRLFPHRPRAMAPLWLLAPGGRGLMLAPLDSFHDQVIAVPRGPERAEEGVRCGWQGDLEGVPAGFATELAVWAGPGPRRLLEQWAAVLRARNRTLRPSRYADDSVARLSYWTDNGAAYWYRTEPGLGIPETLERVAAGLRDARVPVGAFELDSWFYPHEVTRSVNPEGQEHVPPTGMLAWEPRSDLLPDGMDGLRARIGGAPLILHSRHFSSRSPYFARYEAWVDADRAHPTGPELFAHMMEQAATWGAVAFEQDWLVEMFLGVRELRARPGRARSWQEGLDAAAGARGVSLVWCMATPADFFQTLTLRNVVSIRTSGDYRYLSGNASHWVRFLYTNALARALGLHPFKDVFLTVRDATGWDGDPLAEPEALLSALSTGPVGIGDRAGRTDPEVIRSVCRADGVIVKPDVPIAALERCFRADCYFEPEPLIGATHSEHPAGRTAYVAAFNAFRGRRPLAFRVERSDLGEDDPRGPVIALDWRSGSTERLEPGEGFSLSLEPDAWDYRVLSPVLPGEIAVFGDPSLYACAGDRRVRGIRARDGGAELDVVGARGERVEVHGWSRRPLASAAAWTPGADAEAALSQDARGGRWRVRVALGARGWVRLELHGAEA